jgi:hypothetical protein
VLEDVQMEYKGNSASEEMAELSETIKNIYRFLGKKANVCDT